ncbi:D-alanyl-D-alanine carboxypeptidase [Candidatus Microgenomates bacterium]|nr:D-alanyl-D-alanine carboxypeptidase [Candidatus Microgenomates bacterium]
MKHIKHISNKYLMHLSMIAFVFVASVGLSLVNKGIIALPTPTVTRAYDVSPLPVLGDTTSFPVVSAQGVIAIDDQSGVTMYEKNADQPLLPASTTKILTALTALDYFPLDAKLKVSRVSVEGQKMGLVAGEEMTFENMLFGLLVYSGNDAAEVIAENYPGGRELFINQMNIKAKQLHLDHSHFENPVGLDSNNHVSTAKDMVRLARVAMNNPEFAKIVATKEISVSDTSGKIVHRLRNTNELLGEVEGIKGIKTGWTENARENLITYIERNNHKIIIAVLGSQDRFGETKELINWIFSNYTWQEVKQEKIVIEN